MAVEFRNKTECVKYCEVNNLSFFQRDLNASSAKIFVADTYKNIWNKICQNGVEKSSWYESWSANTPMQLYIDYDRKMEIISGSDLKKRAQKAAETTVNHKTDIINIINAMRQFIPSITSVNILKSLPDDKKKSYHIIFNGVYFPKAKSIEIFMEEQLKPKFRELFEKKIIDLAVYKPSCFRTLHSTKFGQNRPLFLLNTDLFLSELQEAIIEPQDVTFEHFLKTCITNIEPDAVLFNYRSEKKKDNTKKIQFSEDDIYTDKAIVKKYIDILDHDRYTDRNKWLNVGYILHSISAEYYDLWHYFSSKWENYNEREADVAWQSFASGENMYTIHTLIHLAKVDNPEEYKDIACEIPDHDIRYLRPFDNIISKLINRLYGNNFVCSDCERNEWYFYNGIRWVKENKSYHLRKLMINDVFNRVENYRKQLVKEGASEELVKNYHNILRLLGSGHKLTCLELEFYNSNFHKIIDHNKNLIGFENGVYDLEAMEFRKGDPSDYVSMSTGYDFQQYDENDPIYQDIVSLVWKILPEENTRLFTLKSLASCLDGHNRDENFYIWAGKASTGANGKTTLTDLLLKALGDYGTISPVSIVTGKRESAASANSALASIRNKRCVILQEPAADDTLQADVIKSLTGGDMISTRELHSSQISFKPNAKIFMCCNRLPAISGVDGGTARRLKITEFLARFVDKPNPDSINLGFYEFKIDRELKNRMESLKAPFMQLLLKYYKIYKEESLKPPQQVLKVTEKYELDNNMIKQFIEENIVRTGTKSDFITKDELKTIYKNDYQLKSSFGKLNNFINQLESSLCIEFKLDIKRNIYKLHGVHIKRPDINDSDSDNDTDNVL